MSAKLMKYIWGYQPCFLLNSEEIEQNYKKPVEAMLFPIANPNNPEEVNVAYEKEGGLEPFTLRLNDIVIFNQQSYRICEETNGVLHPRGWSVDSWINFVSVEPKIILFERKIGH